MPRLAGSTSVSSAGATSRMDGMSNTTASSKAMGRDLICRKDGCVHIVQAKDRGAETIIHEKHIFQLYGTVQLYVMDQEQALIPAKVKAIFITAPSLSPVAQRAARWLDIKLKENCLLDRNYPVIKCNINPATREKIYHLLFDQQYDSTKIIPALHECYVRTVAEFASIP
jgi:hypothetical protein